VTREKNDSIPPLVEDDRSADFSGDTVTTPMDVRPLFGDDQDLVPVLVAMSGKQIGQRLEIKTDRVRIGRADDAEMCVRDGSISRYHAQVFKDRSGRWCVRDLGSTNGTFVKGRRVEEASLDDRDRIQIGESTMLRFEFQGQAEGEFHEKLYQAGTHDPLLGIFNRKYLEEHLEADFKLARRHREPLSLLMIDIDHFKQINDTYGHPTGDRVLTVLTSLLTGRLRGEDLLARYGGEEFSILLRNTPLAGAIAVAESLCVVIGDGPFEVHGKEIAVTISIGVAAYAEATPHRDPKALVAAADGALYRAKKLGRNRVETANLDDALLR